MAQIAAFKAVKFDHYGGIDVLHIDELPLPVPGKGEVLAKVKAAGINPIESKIREGALAAQWPARFPCGEGNDLAGVVDSLGQLTLRPPHVYKLDQMREAFTELEQHHTHGKIVLEP